MNRSGIIFKQVYLKIVSIHVSYLVLCLAFIFESAYIVEKIMYPYASVASVVFVQKVPLILYLLEIISSILSFSACRYLL